LRRRLTVLNTRAEHDGLGATLAGLGKPVIARAPYEFGVKVSIVTPTPVPRAASLLQAKALPGNPYDVHTLRRRRRQKRPRRGREKRKPKRVPRRAGASRADRLGVLEPDGPATSAMSCQAFLKGAPVSVRIGALQAPFK
jgi:hypothetical protein